MEQVSDRVWLAHGPAANWTILHTDVGIVLIDAGFPADTPLVLESVRRTGADPSAVRTVYVTHAHTDHIGGLPGLLRAVPGIEVLAPPAEVDAVRGPDRDQITVTKAGAQLLRPRFLRWAVRAVRDGGTRAITVPSARAFTPHDLDRHGLRAYPAPGHTMGSVVYEIVDADVLVTGDAFVTDHPTYRHPRTGAITAVFSADDDAARATAAAMPRGRRILPGHGPVALPAA